MCVSVLLVCLKETYIFFQCPSQTFGFRIPVNGGETQDLERHVQAYQSWKSGLDPATIEQ